MRSKRSHESSMGSEKALSIEMNKGLDKKDSKDLVEESSFEELAIDLTREKDNVSIDESD